MNIQIYYNKKNFDVQKAERFFKERNIKFQSIDLNKHKLGKKELEVFIRVAGDVENLIDRNSKEVKKHPVALITAKQYVLDCLMEDASCIKSPIVRNGNTATIGCNIETWQKWINS